MIGSYDQSFGGALRGFFQGDRISRRDFGDVPYLEMDHDVLSSLLNNHSWQMRIQTCDDLIGNGPGPSGDIFGRDAFVPVFSYERDRIAFFGFGIPEIHSDIIHRNLAGKGIAIAPEKNRRIFPCGVRVAVAVAEREHGDRGIPLCYKFPAVSDGFSGAEFFDEDDAAFE
jgi:hypothetical protein